MFVVGDSFVAGHGVKQIEHRFSEKLAEMLGDAWEYVVIARNGWQTAQQLKAAGDYPVNPDAVILSYFINDIQGAAEKSGLSIPLYFPQPSSSIKKIIEHSFFLNWIYWRVVRGSMGSDYWNYLKNCYSNREVWYAHTEELSGFIQYAEKRGSDLCVVVWPNFFKIKESLEFTNRVATFFRSKGIPVVDLADYFKNRSASELIVNHMDDHPNPETHQKAATLIYEKLIKMGVAEP